MKQKRKLRVALIFGGESAERNVSINTATQIAMHLDKTQYTVTPLEILQDGTWTGDSKAIRAMAKVAKVTVSRSITQEFVVTRTKKSSIDLAFIAMHGPKGEDGTIQGLLELLHIPYTFSGVLASSLAMNKIKTQQLVSGSGIVCPAAIIVTKKELTASPRAVALLIRKLSKKVVIKPNRLGSSVGIQIIDSTSSKLLDVLRTTLRFDTEAVVQQFVKGREITAPVIGNEDPKALPLIEIVPTAKSSAFYDYTAKYAQGGSEHIIPAPILKSVGKKIQESALAVHRLVGCRGVSRSDFILTPAGKFYFLEINTIPGMTSTSLLPQSAEVSGIPFSKLLDTIIQLARKS